MNVTLDSIRAATEAKYGSYNIQISKDVAVRLLNPIRLTKDARDRLLALPDEMRKPDADHVAVLRDAIAALAETEDGAKLLLDALGDDAALLTEVFAGYMIATQVGEASASAS